MFGRRLLVLVAILMGLTAVAASVTAPPQQRTERGGGTPEASPSPASPAATPSVVTARLRAGAPVRRVRARVGDTVVLDVSGNVVGAVTIDGLDQLDAIDPQSPAHFELYADEPGHFPIRVLDMGTKVGVLEVASA